MKKSLVVLIPPSELQSVLGKLRADGASVHVVPVDSVALKTPILALRQYVTPDGGMRVLAQVIIPKQKGKEK